MEQRVYDGANRADLRRALEEFGLSPNKKLGQNFLCDGHACDEIVRAAGPLSEKAVLEIGPGPGALTVRLVRAAKRVTALELDAGLCRLLDDRVPKENFTLVHGDALKENLTALLPEEKAAVVANLPYYVTTPILMRLLHELPQVDVMVLMMQKEVAQRLCAKPGGKAYGSLSIAVQYYAQAETVLQVSPNCFFPQPDVESTVVRLTRRAFSQTPQDETLFFEVVRQAFAMRRKTLWNNLAKLRHMGKEKAKAALEAAGLEASVRGEQVSIEQFVQLSDQVQKLLEG